MFTRHWKTTDLQLIRQRYPDEGPHKLAVMLNRSVIAIRRQVSIMGIKRNPDILRQERAKFMADRVNGARLIRKGRS